jgi:hypothetical protein
MIICIFVRVTNDFSSFTVKAATRIYIFYSDVAATRPKGIPKAKSVKSLLVPSGQSSRVYPNALQIKQMIAESRQRSLMGEKG